MSDDWKPGDLALCVAKSADGEHCICPGWSAQIGGVYTVTTVIPPDALADWFGLQFAEDATPLTDDVAAFDAARFRKINPLTDKERDEFLEELRELA